MSFYEKIWSLKNTWFGLKLRELGDYIQIACPAFFLVWSACFGTNELSRVFIVTFLLAMGIYLLLNCIFNNIRPSEDTTNKEAPDMKVDWSPYEGNSFPSGHTMAAVCGGIFWFEISFTMGCIGLFLGLMTGASRVIAKKHWLRDVLTSTFISIGLYSLATFYFV